jgi:hypothetical protein
MKKIINFFTNKEYVPVRVFIIASFILILYAVWDYTNKKSKNEKLLKYNYSYAIVTNKMSSTYKSLSNIDYKYYINNQEIQIMHEEIGQDDFDNLNELDTIFIKYSKDDNSIAEIVHCYWNDELRKKIVSK